MKEDPDLLVQLMVDSFSDYDGINVRDSNNLVAFK